MLMPSFVSLDKILIKLMKLLFLNFSISYPMLELSSIEIPILSNVLFWNTDAPSPRPT